MTDATSRAPGRPAPDWRAAGFATRAVHAGQDPDPRTGAVSVPVYQTSTYAQRGVGEHTGWEYARTGNPTRDALQERLAALEGGRHGIAFASGLAACDAVVRLLAPGDHVLVANDVYGGTWRQLDRVHGAWGLSFEAADLSDRRALEDGWRPETRMVWVETPTNPLLSIIDIAAVAAFAHERGAVVVVDSTFATPYLQQPLALGADIALHSTTKYLGGHSDVVGGAVVVDDDESAERLLFLQNAVGAIPGPWDCWLVLRGLQTLPLRMQAHCHNARAVADVLTRSDAVTEVLYPGLDAHPGADVAARQMRDAGGMVAFRVADVDTAVEICGRFQVFTLAESLGGVESLVEHPGRMTHASTAGSPIEVPADLVRLSVGVEDAADLVADVEQALGS